MLGRNHIIITLLVTGLLFLPLFGPSAFLGLLFFGIIVGSILPDIDAEDGAIRHSRIAGLHFLDVFARIFPFIAIITSWFIYLPAEIFLLGRDKHRGLMHSLLGSLLIFLGWSAIFVLIFLVLLKTEFSSFVVLLHFPIGLFVGSVMHLAEDSFTAEGVNWAYPFEFRVHGNIRTGGLREEIVMVLFVIGSILILFFSGINSQITSALALFELLAIYVISYFLGIF